jgi:alpha-tubulin suppressor-like RCC1 family protein
VNFFANDYIPYALAPIPDDGATLTASQLANRDKRGCGGYCPTIYAFDQGTISISHELVEAATDAYPFSGWSNIAFFPPWYDGEIADICDLDCNNMSVGSRVTRIGNTALSTYWSNGAVECVGPWRPAIHIVTPAAGDIAWRARGVTVDADVSIDDPLTHGDHAIEGVKWTLDGIPEFNTGLLSLPSPISLTLGSLGPHQITATFIDPESNDTASDTVTVNVVDVPANISIDSPNDGATLVVGTPWTLAGSVTNLDNPSGAPGSSLVWSVDGASAGTGLSVTGPSLGVGDHTITLSFTDSAGVTQTLSHTIHVIPSGSLSFRRQIAAYNSHTCGLLPDGTSKCWGNDSWGELGDGQTLVTHVAPVRVSGFTGGVSIAEASASSCALVYDGTVRCWGNNPAGELGDGTTTQESTPVTVNGITNATAIAMGNDHACVILSDKTVQCWGSNGNGQLGDGTTVSRSTAAPVPGLTNVEQLFAGGWWTCGVLTDKTVVCWGTQFFGPGAGGSTDYGSTPTPVPGLSNVVAVASNEYHACALLADATVSCWGWNAYGQLGDGTTTDSGTPVPVVGLTGVQLISAGGAHTCAILSDSSVQCWGDGISGQLGNGSFLPSSHPVPVTGLTGVTQLAAGSEYTCALSNGGGASCWGSNADGQLGNASVSSTSVIGTSTPVPVIGWP